MATKKTTTEQGLDGRGEPVYHVVTTYTHPNGRTSYHTESFSTKAERSAWLQWAGI